MIILEGITIMEIKEFLLIKLLEGITSENHLEQSFVNQENKFYNVEGLKQANIDCLNSMSDRSTMLVIFVAFKENSGDFSPIKLFCAEGSKNDRGNITYVAKHKCDSAFVVQNFMKNFIVDLKSDFEQDVYLAKMEMSTKFLDQLEQDIMFFEPSITHGIAFSKNTHETNYRNMHPFAQTNEDCKRIFADANNELGISEFQIDRNSIIFSRAFRRMVDKAQIYTSSKGDHFRSRMTHTLEVCQIARAIGIKLNLNLDLIETIALAHDIGHTPFGHQGERTLNSEIQNKDRKDGTRLEYGGFKHNYHALRVLTYLEESKTEYEGLNISYQVLEGVLKHTKLSNEYDISQFLANGNAEHLFMDKSEPTTLEGQVVKIADEIAQRSHDIEDSFSARHLSYDELHSYLSTGKTTELKKLLEDCNNSIRTVKASRIIADEASLLKSMISAKIIDYFVNDVYTQSKINMTNFDETDDFYQAYHKFDKKIITLSDKGLFLLIYLENIINKRVINSSEVASFDGKASLIIRSLFSEFYQNPVKLPDTTLNRIYREMRKNCLSTTRYRNSDITLLRDEITRIHNAVNEEYKQKNKILVRNIIDYIAGMTDTYAINQYHQLLG